MPKMYDDLLVQANKRYQKKEPEDDFTKVTQNMVSFLQSNNILDDHVKQEKTGLFLKKSRKWPCKYKGRVKPERNVRFLDN